MTILTSFGDKLNILFKGNYFIIGIFFFLIGGILSVVFISKTDFKSILYFNTDLIHTEAIVINIHETNSSTNDNRILEYEYRFLEYDETQTGFSYSYDSPISINDTVQIEFVKNDLNTSRIVGMTNAPYELYVGGFVLIFPLLGLGLIVSDLKKLFNYLMILNDFSFTKGELLTKEKTSTEINDSPLYKIKYKYELHQKNYINTSRSFSPKELKEN